MNGNFSGTGNTKAKNDYWSKPAAIPPSHNRKQVPLAETDPAAEPPGTGYCPVPVTLESVDYLPGLLSKLIGERVRVQFLIGTNGPMIDITGTLTQAGANYIVVQPIESDDYTICDLYSIKFVTIIR